MGGELGAAGIDWNITVKVGSTLFIGGPDFVPVSLNSFTLVQVRQCLFLYKLILLVRSMCTTLDTRNRKRYCMTLTRFLVPVYFPKQVKGIV